MPVKDTAYGKPLKRAVTRVYVSQFLKTMAAYVYASF